MTCTGCRRAVLRTWGLDGTAARYCAGCLRRALREADWRDADRRVRDIMRRSETGGGWT